MIALREYQGRLAAALVAGDREAALCLFGGDEARRSLGLQVYANNWMHRLVSALAETFPSVRAITGDGVFTAMAVAYVRNRPPPRDELLIWYGSSFPDFIEAAGIAGPPYLGDLARLELAWLEAYHSAEAQPLPLAAIAALTAEQLVRARLRLHPSARLLRSDYPVERIRARCLRPDSEETAATQPGAPSCLAILRPGAEVGIMRISPPTFAALGRLRDGAPFGEATNGLVPGEHLEELQALIEAGLFTTIDAHP
jgi:hypothetical protein